MNFILSHSMANPEGAPSSDFDPQINVFELGQKIRKLDAYIGRAELRLKKRNKQLDKLVRMSEEEEKLLAIGVQLIDPDKAKGSEA